MDMPLDVNALAVDLPTQLDANALVVDPPMLLDAVVEVVWMEDQLLMLLDAVVEAVQVDTPLDASAPTAWVLDLSL